MFLWVGVGWERPGWGGAVVNLPASCASGTPARWGIFGVLVPKAWLCLSERTSTMTGDGGRDGKLCCFVSL